MKITLTKLNMQIFISMLNKNYHKIFNYLLFKYVFAIFYNIKHSMQNLFLFMRMEIHNDSFLNICKYAHNNDK